VWFVVKILIKSAAPLVVLGLGSNKGDSRQIILDTVKALERILTDLRRASLYETEPMYVKDQGCFINTAVAGFFRGIPSIPNLPSLPKSHGLPNAPKDLLSAIHDLEAKFGRDRKQERRWGERSLDIDILLFGDLVINEADLQIPHPRLKERRFALEPLLELLPDALEPVTGLSYRIMCNALPEQGVKRLEC